MSDTADRILYYLTIRKKHEERVTWIAIRVRTSHHFLCFRYLTIIFGSILKILILRTKPTLQFSQFLEGIRVAEVSRSYVQRKKHFIPNTTKMFAMGLL